MSIYTRSLRFVDFIKNLISDASVTEEDGANLEAAIVDFIEENTFQNDEVLEEFEGMTENNSSEFTSGENRFFVTTGEWLVSNIEGFGSSTENPPEVSSDWFLDNSFIKGSSSGLVGLKLIKSKIKFRNFRVYPLNDSVFDSYEGQINVILKLKGAEVFSRVYDVNSNFPSAHNGFSLVDIESYYTGFCDELEIQMLGDMTILSMDNMTYIK